MSNYNSILHLAQGLASLATKRRRVLVRLGLTPLVELPRRLWSLWDMLTTHALLFAQAAISLNEAKWICFNIQRDIQTLPSADNEDNRVRVAAVGRHGLTQLKQAAIFSDMQEFLPEIDRLLTQLRILTTDTSLKFETVGQGFRHLVTRIQDVLKQEYYFHVDQRDVQFYLTEKPFGAEVAQTFDKANEDIGEAAKCVALQRPTACVFHLMRVMELGVQGLGKHLKVKIRVQEETWHQIMLHVNKAVESLPSKTSVQKKKKSRLAEIAAHLQSVRLAWRNEVMHPKQTYTRDEALTIFNNCKAFMQHLADVI